jgi:hypothetical protein
MKKPSSEWPDEARNLLTMRPRHLRKWEKTEGGRVVVFKPKFGDHAIGRWFMARMRNPYYRIKLDDFGSVVWEMCDGQATVKEIGKTLQERFGERVDPVYDRLAVFFQQLERSRLIRLE